MSDHSLTRPATVPPVGSRQAARLWAALESIPGPSAVRQAWRDQLGPPYAFFKPAFLKPVPGRLAGSVPCPLFCGCWHLVIQCEDGSLIAGCQCGSDRGPFTLTRDDITLWEPDWPKLAAAICAALGFRLKIARLFDLRNTLQLGRYPPGDTPVVFSIQFIQADLLHALSTLATRLPQPFIFLTPTSRHLDQAAVEALFDLGYHTKNVDVIFKRVFGRA